MSHLATLNNNEAAKRAARRNTPYVPWNTAETFEGSFPARLPKLNSVRDPQGWEWIGDITVHHGQTVGAAVRFTLNEYHLFPVVGVAFVADGRLGFFVPNEEAHLPEKAEW